MSELRSLYPEIGPYDVGTLQVSGGHAIYFEQSGSPSGKPAVFLHGGPGGGSDARHRRFFDPNAYRIIVLDQRGCGRSTPFASLEQNTTWHLVADLEALRTKLGIERWQVFGGSWGSTLALAYAQKYPERVTELVLRGIFLLRKREIDWFYQEGASRLFPDAWEEYLAPIPEAERGALLHAYHKRLTGTDAGERVRAAKAWSVWEAKTSCLIPNEQLIAKNAEDEYALAFARIECHYFVNDGFFDRDDELLVNASKIQRIPGVIVQGRYDVVCPAESAWALHRAWPQAKLKIVGDAGHAALELGTLHELITATDSFR